MSTPIRTRFTSDTQLGIFMKELQSKLDWGWEGFFGPQTGDGVLDVMREGHLFLRCPSNIRGYGSIRVLEVVVVDDTDSNVDYVKQHIDEVKSRVYSI